MLELLLGLTVVCCPTPVRVSYHNPTIHLQSVQAATPVSLKATAGLRLLPGDKADKILAAVTALLKSHPFKMAGDAVAIMDGGWRLMGVLQLARACRGVQVEQRDPYSHVGIT